MRIESDVKQAIDRLSDQDYQVASWLVGDIEQAEIATTNCDIEQLLKSIKQAGSHQLDLLMETKPLPGVPMPPRGLEELQDALLVDKWAEQSLAAALRRLKCGEEYADAGLSYGDIPAGL